MLSYTMFRSLLPCIHRCMLLVAGFILLALIASPVRAQTSTAPAAPAQNANPTTDQPAAIKELLRLLADPQVQEWLKTTQQPSASSPSPSSPLATSPETATTIDVTDEINTLAITLTERLARARKHIQDVTEELPDLPTEIALAGKRLQKNASGIDTSGIVLRVLLAAGLGVFFRLIFISYVKLHGSENNKIHMTPGKRLRHFLTRVVFAIGPSLAFAVGALIPFVMFEWPILIKHTAINYLIALLGIQIIYDICHAILVRTTYKRKSLYNQKLRRFWFLRTVLFLGYFIWAWATVGILFAANVPHHSIHAIAYILGLIQLAMAFEIIWRRPQQPEANETSRRHRITYNILLSIYGVLLWMLWAANLDGLFWLGVLALLLPTLILANDSFVRDVIRPEEGIYSERASLLEVGFERGIRVLIVIAAVLWLAHIWQLDLVELTSRDTALTRLVRGLLNAAIILLLADFLWQIARTIIDMRLIAAQKAMDATPHGVATSSTETPGQEGGGEDLVKQARLRTLLPIFRNILLVTIIIIAGLMMLSELGVQIAPLIAGAGVVGVAVGFGSQTIVKDVISGIFYLLDDAFRVGEYIQSGNYKGTVESFSLRSVKLRHQRGPIYTVPFGQLGAVQNMSRDWVMDKFQIGVTYDTDLEEARKIIKNIGAELAADPEFGPHILQPLKMQGVQEFGQYGIEIRCKIMTRPGEQFVVRRTAFKRIKQEFDKAGIKFALPSVQVAGGAEPGAAAMQVHRAIENAREASKEE